MGMYTELHFNAEVRDDAEALPILQFMVDHHAPAPTTLPDHPLFSRERWRFMLTCDSCYFAADTRSTLRTQRYADGAYHYLCVRCNLKNYEQEIQLFIDWIMPYLDKEDGEFLGFYRYEETEEPTLIYMKAAV